jgi:hypothetical protein
MFLKIQLEKAEILRLFFCLKVRSRPSVELLDLMQLKSFIENRPKQKRL